MPQRAQVLDIEPKEVICFKGLCCLSCHLFALICLFADLGPFTRTVTETVRLTNPTSKKIAFKVKTTDTKHCCINPCKGVIDAGSTVSITIMVQPRTQPVDGERTPPKFLFQAIEVPEGELRLDELVKLVRRLVLLPKTLHLSSILVQISQPRQRDGLKVDLCVRKPKRGGRIRCQQQTGQNTDRCG